MVIRKEELALYSLSLLEADDRPNVTFSKENLAYAMDISVSTLDLYFTKLKKLEFIIRHKRKYYDDIRQTVEISEEGKKKLIQIKNKVNNSYLTPERHNIPRMVKIPIILNRINDIFEKIFFLSLYTKLKRFDLPFFIETIKTSKQENNVVNVLSEIGQGEELQELPVVETFFRTCFYGVSEKTCIGDLGKRKIDDPNSLLIVAEASTKQGRYSEARMIYEHLLSAKLPLTQNQWTIASINLAFLDSKEGKTDASLEKLEKIYTMLDNKIFKSYVKQMIGRVYSASGDQNKAMDYYNSAINSFHTFGFPLLLSIAYNNRGVVHYYNKDKTKAEEDWLKAKKYAIKAESRYVEGAIYNNLADVELLKGNIEKSKRYIDAGYEIYSEVNDYEGLAEIEFQRALYFLKTCDLENAIKCYERSESIAFPSPSPGQREFRRNYFLERGKECGFNDEQLIKIK